MSENTDTKTPATFNEGDEATIIRGPHKGVTVTVLGKDVDRDAYAVKFPGANHFATINATNLKTPAERTWTLSEIQAVLAGLEDGFSANDVDALERAFPGIEF